MFQAILYGAISGLALVVGALVGLSFHWKQKVIAAFMAFGSGILICALAFGLMAEAYRHGGLDAIIIGFLAGGLVFIGGDYLLHIYGGRKHKRRQLYQSKHITGGRVIVLGAIIDGVPESVALGVALFNSAAIGFLMLVAIFLSNFPESIASLTGLKNEGFKNRRIYLLWGLVGIVTLGVTVASYQFLHGLSKNTLGIIEAFAAGSILAMLANSMIPEAYEEGGTAVGLLTVLGFLVAFVLSRF